MIQIFDEISPNIACKHCGKKELMFNCETNIGYNTIIIRYVCRKCGLITRKAV